MGRKPDQDHAREERVTVRLSRAGRQEIQRWLRPGEDESKFIREAARLLCVDRSKGSAR